MQPHADAHKLHVSVCNTVLPKSFHGICLKPQLEPLRVLSSCQFETEMCTDEIEVDFVVLIRISCGL